MAALAAGQVGQPRLAAAYRITCKGTSFGGERVWLGRGRDGRKELRAQIFDPHQGQSAASLGSVAELRQGTWRVERLADVPVGKGMSAPRRYKIHTEGSSPSILTLDGQGWPLAWEQQQLGALVEHRRIESPESKH